MEENVDPVIQKLVEFIEKKTTDKDAEVLHKAILRRLGKEEEKDEATELWSWLKLFSVQEMTGVSYIGSSSYTGTVATPKLDNMLAFHYSKDYNQLNELRLLFNNYMVGDEKRSTPAIMKNITRNMGTSDSDSYKIAGRMLTILQQNQKK